MSLVPVGEHGVAGWVPVERIRGTESEGIKRGGDQQCGRNAFKINCVIPQRSGLGHVQLTGSGTKLVGVDSGGPCGTLPRADRLLGVLGLPFACSCTLCPLELCYFRLLL